MLRSRIDGFGRPGFRECMCGSFWMGFYRQLISGFWTGFLDLDLVQEFRWMGVSGNLLVCALATTQNGIRRCLNYPKARQRFKLDVAKTMTARTKLHAHFFLPAFQMVAARHAACQGSLVLWYTPCNLEIPHVVVSFTPHSFSKY